MVLNKKIYCESSFWALLNNANVHNSFACVVLSSSPDFKQHESSSPAKQNISRKAAGLKNKGTNVRTRTSSDADVVSGDDEYMTMIGCREAGHFLFNGPIRVLGG